MVDLGLCFVGDFKLAWHTGSFRRGSGLAGRTSRIEFAFLWSYVSAAIVTQ